MVDLDNLSTEEADFAHAFLDRLEAHGKVCCTDFETMAPDRFEELAEAIMAAMNKVNLQ